MQRRLITVIVPLLALSLAALFAAAAIGSVPLRLGEIFEVLGGNGSQRARMLVLELRLPRALSAFATGGLLALAGALMQVLLRNPLADPYILGVSGGAAVAALSAIMLGLGGIWVDSAAFAGALGATWIVFALSRGSGAWNGNRLLLTGVVIAAGFGAIISLLLSLGTDTGLRSMIFWLLGDFSFADQPLDEWLVLVVAVTFAMLIARPLNVLAGGTTQAMTLGVEVARMRFVIYVLSALITAVAVTTAGTIGFVGLLVPHLVRLRAGSDHRIVLPASALLGGILLVAADTAARTVAAPRQLPVGAITALLGVPLFLYLMGRRSS
ncbi:MAG: iron ABC transporter permease [Gammaproteobacteria bacterium]|nr:iron ABC transporter permease [Gammaproteobacteria bacterium]NNF61079.1 iron ABC transporter permease [Gammaproteobacteria bacterium]NNM21408.1 iron ABC transporter permease [Gammaproteobacteria bacterium]